MTEPELRIAIQEAQANLDRLKAGIGAATPTPAPTLESIRPGMSVQERAAVLARLVEVLNNR